MIEITYKKQGDDRDSWIVVTDIEIFKLDGESKFMLYEPPIEYLRVRILNDILKKYDYNSVEEVLIWADDEKYGNEARLILAWYRDIYKQTEEQINNGSNIDEYLLFYENILKASKEELYLSIKNNNRKFKL